jgi:ubiquitin carboxyl-terminal hydrolase 14
VRLLSALRDTRRFHLVSIRAEGPIAASASTSGGAGSGEAMVDDDLTAAIAMSMGGTSTSTAASPTSVLDEAGLTSAFKGTYELYGVVTHKGRSADAGHYMGWVRIKGGIV